jgi:BASS family bile acid:Na+ symporter
MTWIPTATLFVMMAALGMTLRVEDFRRLLAAPRAAVFGLMGQLVLLPAVAFAIASALELSHHLAVGLVLIAACPGGVSSNVLSWLARGNVALSISLTAGSSMVSFITVPFLVALAMVTFGGEGTPVEMSMLEMVTTLFGSTALPVLLGMATLHVRPALAERLHRPLLGISGSVLLLLIVGLGFSVWGSVEDMAGLVTRATPPVFLLIAVMTAIGFGGARLLGLDASTGRTLGIEIGIQNFNLALVVAFSILDEPLFLGSALIYLPVMMTFAGAVIALGRRADAGTAPTQPALDLS